MTAQDMAEVFELGATECKWGYDLPPQLNPMLPPI